MDSFGSRRHIRDWLGDRLEVHGRIHSTLAHRRNSGGNGNQSGSPGCGHEVTAGGTSYAVWVGVGAVGTAILGMVLLGEPASLGRVLSLGLIVAGIVGLKLAT